MRQPRVLVIQDISASCRISMNVALPVLSCLNNGVNILPTALLSTHTGSSFPNYTFLDLTKELKHILHHWSELDLKFDGILIGYLGSLEQISLVEEILSTFLKEDGISVLDPVMGDRGVLYSGFNDEYVSQMRQLCKKASVLIPNMTEASFLLKKNYITIPYTEEIIHEYLQELSHLHNGKSVLKGISYDRKNIGIACFDPMEQKYASAMAPIHPAHFDGTGDLFSSVTAGYLFQGKSLTFATKTAVEYMDRVIVRTLESGMDLKYGIQFETDLPYLIEKLYQ